MKFRSNDTGNIIHWNYLLASDNGDILNIWGTNTGVEAFWYSERPVGGAEWTALIASVGKSIKADKAKVAAEKGKLEEWTLFINPFRRMDFMIRRLRELLDGVHSDPVRLVEEPSADEAAMKARWETLVKKMDEFRHAQMYALALRVLVPIWVESFVNLLIFLLAKKQIKADQRLMESTIRQAIDVRVKSLSLTCDHFVKAIDGTSAEFKSFHTLMNGRNDLLHGNIEPKRLMFDTVWCDGMIPLFATDIPLLDRMHSNENRFIEASAAKSDMDTAKAFIEYVLSCLSDKVRPTVTQFMTNIHPGWHAKDGRLGLIFAESIVASMPMFRSGETIQPQGGGESGH